MVDAGEGRFGDVDTCSRDTSLVPLGAGAAGVGAAALVVAVPVLLR